MRAFNAETAIIKDQVKNVSTGTFRIQWWRDTIDRVYEGDAPNQPVAKALVPIVQRHKLTKSWFMRILDARVRTVFFLLDDIRLSLIEG